MATMVKRFTAFTLAEVLIVISIIGVIAQMTIPALMQNVQDKVTVVSLKKTYSTLSNAFTLAVQEDGAPNTWDLGGAGTPQGALNILDHFVPYLKVTQECGISGGCFPTGVLYKRLDGLPQYDYSAANGFATAQLQDGSLLATWSQGSCPTVNNYCGFLMVDVNGNKNPNTFGIDMFWFQLRPTRISPYGYWNADMSLDCNKKSTDNDNGRVCTAWVLFNENMDYLHCDGLAWGGKTKCN